MDGRGRYDRDRVRLSGNVPTFERWANRFGYDWQFSDRTDRAFAWRNPTWSSWNNWNTWDNYWSGRHVPRGYRSWYSGTWYNRWPNQWNRSWMPLGYGVFGWGLNDLAYRSGYWNYANPYYSSGLFSSPVTYYSSPVVIASYDDDSAVGYFGTREAGVDEFENAREAFKRGDYDEALDETRAALALRPKDPVVHEFHALCYFSLGEYPKAAAVLNSLLATAPGWNWATMSNLYSAVPEYEGQLRTLEQFRNANPQDASARFVLGYHYLVTGYPAAAEKEFAKVVELQPADQVAARLAKALGSPASEPPPIIEPASGVEAVDLVGKWMTKREDGTRFQMEIREDGTFAWSSELASDKRVHVTGKYSKVDDTLILDGNNEGTMTAKIAPLSTDAFTFTLVGGPASDPGLRFERAK